MSEGLGEDPIDWTEYTFNVRTLDLPADLETLAQELERMASNDRTYAAHRRWAACLLPFMRQLIRDQAHPFWEDLLVLETNRGPDRDANERQLEALARRYQLPYPAAWVQPLTTLLLYPYVQSIVVSLPSHF